VEKRGAFLTSPSLVFAQGQEQRLRKALLLDQRGNMVKASVSPPGGMLSMTTLAPALLILDAEHRADRVRFVDLSGMEGERGSKHRLGKDLNLEAASRLLNSDDAQPQLAEDIDLQEIEKLDFSLVPQRYLRRVENLAGNRRPLGDLLAATIRSPVPTKDLNAWPVWEIGIPRLDQWRPISSGYDRHMNITPKKADEALLREGDLVLSIKGTVGKVGIVGDIPSSYADAAVDTTKAHLLSVQPLEEGAPACTAAVAAASCVALRVDRQQLLPEYLLLYLRSDDFKQQLEALRVGATIAHITPAALLTGVQVLVLPLEEQAVLCDQYRELCKMEAQVEDLQRRMSQARDQLFATTNQQN
jgi:type I restriction-modification system DNA methylase subunit